jgi:hypothetical protein
MTPIAKFSFIRLSYFYNWAICSRARISFGLMSGKFLMEWACSYVGSGDPFFEAERK